MCRSLRATSATWECDQAGGVESGTAVPRSIGRFRVAWSASANANGSVALFSGGRARHCAWQGGDAVVDYAVDHVGRLGMRRVRGLEAAALVVADGRARRLYWRLRNRSHSGSRNLEEIRPGCLACDQLRQMPMERQLLERPVAAI